MTKRELKRLEFKRFVRKELAVLLSKCKYHLNKKKSQDIVISHLEEQTIRIVEAAYPTVFLYPYNFWARQWYKLKHLLWK